jgi:hypothetical protein
MRWLGNHGYDDWAAISIHGGEIWYGADDIRRGGMGHNLLTHVPCGNFATQEHS